jgi:hypothetical protein
MRFGEAVSLRPGAYAGSCAARDNELLTLCMLMPDAQFWAKSTNFRGKRRPPPESYWQTRESICSAPPPPMCVCPIFRQLSWWPTKNAQSKLWPREGFKESAPWRATLRKYATHSANLPLRC